MAAKHGQGNIVKQLLGHPGIEVNLQDSEGRTALEWAKEKGYEKLIKMFEDKMSSNKMIKMLEDKMSSNNKMIKMLEDKLSCLPIE